MNSVSSAYDVKISDFVFLNNIEACHVNNHSPRNEINVIYTFRESAKVDFLTLQNKERLELNI